MNWLDSKLTYKKPTVQKKTDETIVVLFHLSTLPVGYLLDGARFKWSLQMLGQITVCVPRDSIRVHNTLYLAPSVKMRFPIIVIPIFDLWLHANTRKMKCQCKNVKKRNNV